MQLFMVDCHATITKMRMDLLNRNDAVLYIIISAMLAHGLITSVAQNNIIGMIFFVILGAIVTTIQGQIRS